MLKHKGLTLIELMIAIGINAILLAAIISAFITNANHYTRMIQQGRFNQQLQSSMQIMSSDIRRAGYWGQAVSDVGKGSNNNPFLKGINDVNVNSAGNCILFTYDFNRTGNVNTNQFGFKLQDNTIQIKPSNGTFSCTATNWENMTDPGSIKITQLHFDLKTKTLPNGLGISKLIIRTVTITLTAEIPNDPTYTKTVTQEVRIRNDNYQV